MILLITVITLLWLLWRYAGLVFVSWLLSLLTKCEIRVGAVGLFEISDIHLRIGRYLTIHIDSCALHRDRTHPTRLCVLRLGDVRIEGEPKKLSTPSTSNGKRGGRSKENGGGMNADDQMRARLYRLGQIAQYCGLFVNRVHLVLLEVIPECMLHVTVDELSIEMFRSRDGWQLETGCRLIQAKVLRRYAPSGRLLTEISFPLQLSVDVTKSRINKIIVKVSDPSVSITNGLIDIINTIVLQSQSQTVDDVGDQKESKSDDESVRMLHEESSSSQSLWTVDWRSHLNVEIRAAAFKYTGGTQEDSRYMTLNVRAVDVLRCDDNFQLKVDGLVLQDQMQKSALRTSSWSIDISEVASENETSSMKCRASSDHIHTSLTFNDALWWKNHIEGVARTWKYDRKRRTSADVSSNGRTPSRGINKKSVGILLEFASFSCDIVDFEMCKTRLSAEFISIQKNDDEWEIGVEMLSFASSGGSSSFKGQSFNEHAWGQSVFVGVALVQFNTTLRLLTVGADDVKLEWSQRLARQINDVISILGSNESMDKTRKKVPLGLRVTVNKLAAIVVPEKASYAAVCCEKVDVESADVYGEVVFGTQLLRAAVGTARRENGFQMNEIFKAGRTRVVSPKERSSSPSRRWSQKERGRMNKEHREAADSDIDPRLCISSTELRVNVDRRSTVIDSFHFACSDDVYLSWSPLLHLIIKEFCGSVKSTFSKKEEMSSVKRRKVPRKLHLYVTLNAKVELQLELARSHRMLWRADTLQVELIEGQLTMRTILLEILFNAECIVTVENALIAVRQSDQMMTSSRVAFATLVSKANKVWTWAADKFRFHLPFEFNFAHVFDEFVNMFKWLKVVHGMKKKEFTAESPLPSDIRIEFKEVILELDDDDFENRLQASHELKEDEVFECERRNQILEERLMALKKTVPLISKETMEELIANMTQKNSEIYVERWNKTDFSARSLFVSRWKGWSMRAFADKSLHGTEKCIELIKVFDPLSIFPEEGLIFSTLWARAVEFDVEEWTVNFKDYPMKYLDINDLHFFGTLVGAETFQEGGRSLRENDIPMPEPWPTHVIQRNMSPLKFYYDLQCASNEFTCTYGSCWEPCLSMVSLMWNNISSPSRDPSRPLPFWDKMRYLLHGRLLWSSEKFVTTMLASNDPYNETETVEMCWDDFGLDWALGEVRIKSGLRIFTRTASRYDDSRVLHLPDVRLKVLLGWECAGDPHDHHSVVLCAPHRLPHYSSRDEHDTYRSFRSTCVNVTLNFDVSPGSCTSAERMPHVLLYANTFRCIEQFLKSLTMKNRNVRRGKVFGNAVPLKPQLSKHFGKLQVSITLPKVVVTYWMSHSSPYGFRLFSDGLQLTASFRQTVQHSSTNRDKNVRRRKVYTWSTHHMTCTWWATQVHVYGEDSRPPSDGVPSEETFLLGFSRVQYARETYPGKETPVHKVTAYDLKMSWTAENRNACLTLADGVHRAHMLRRILSNDAVKTLNVHLEEADDLSEEEKKKEKETEAKKDAAKVQSHRRGYSVSDANPWMLNQLIDEVGTKLVAHCEQASDVPIDSLVGVQQSTSDDVRLLNWQVDLFNSQLVLKGCQRDGFLLVSAAKAQLLQNLHRSVWRGDLLLSKKSWSALLSGMQYFAPISMTGENKETFRWLPREVIEEKSSQDTAGFADDFVQKFSASGEAVGGVVQPETDASSEERRRQLQRIVSRCSCQIYFCYFSDELKTDSNEDIAIPPKQEEKSGGPSGSESSLDEIGVDVLTLKHNMLEATSNSEQYEMVVDIVNNLVIYVDPKKKEMAEKRRRLRFESQMMDMQQLRQKIMRYQSDLREIVSLVRYLERQIFYLQQEQDVQTEENSGEKREQVRIELDDKKQLMLLVSDKLATYISCYKQRQVNSTRAEEQMIQKDVAAQLVRRFEVCFEDCIWKLTENDGQIALAQTQIRNFLYTRTIRTENSGDHLFEVGSVRVTNMLPDTVYKHTLHRDETKYSRQPAVRLFMRDMPPVGGICVKEHFELNIAPMVAEITHRLFDKMMRFFFPGRNIHNQENLDAAGGETETSTFSFTRRIASSLSMRNNRSSNDKIVLKPWEKDDIDRMRERADEINHFMYIKIPEVSFVVSYKGNKDKNLIDVFKFNFVFPLCEFHEKNWTWLDLALAVKQRCKRVLLQQFMRQKLLRNRISNLAIEQPQQGVSEEEKKRIAVGVTSLEKKRKK